MQLRPFAGGCGGELVLRSYFAVSFRFFWRQRWSMTRRRSDNLRRKVAFLSTVSAHSCAASITTQYVQTGHTTYPDTRIGDVFCDASG